MKYRLGDICTITKGATGIMKAVPGVYPMVTLAEERKQHDEYQFDAAAVIVPLISSTGHGHASIKRIHYQEGKFALGTILCAVIPKDAALLNSRYLFVYLQQFKDSVLVPLMKGAANVSLPMNKLASLEIEVPSLVKQQEVIDLAYVLTGHKDDLEALLDAQQEDTVKLRQALLREAMQGQLLPQDPTDEPAAELLKKLQAAKAATGKARKGKAGALFAEEAEAVEGPFEIPASWVWCTVGDIASKIGSGSTPKAGYSKEGVPFFRSQNIYEGGLELSDVVFISQDVHRSMRGTQVQEDDVLLNITGGSLGRATLVTELPSGGNVSQHVCIVRSETLDSRFLHKLILSPYFQDLIFSSTSGAGRQGLPKYNLEQFLIPIPPKAEQHRIVAKLEQLMQHCDALEQRIRESRRLAEQLLQTALREALAPPAGSAPADEAEEPVAAAAVAALRRGRGRPPKAQHPQPDLFDLP